MERRQAIGLCISLLFVSFMGTGLAGPDTTGELPRTTPVGVLIHRAAADTVRTLWRGNPGGPEACNIVHNGYGGTRDRTLALLADCARQTGGRMRVLVRPNAQHIGSYIKALLRSPHADLILGWYIADEPFAFPWNVDDIPRQGETRAEFWLRYRREHNGTPPWPAKVPAECVAAGQLTKDELAGIAARGGDDLYWIFRNLETLRRAEDQMTGKSTCRNKTVRDGGHLPIFADYGSLCPVYALVKGRIVPGAPLTRRLGYWWHDDDRKEPTWRAGGSVLWRGKRIWRQFSAFGEDVVIDNWFGSPCEADGTPRPRSHNRIDQAHWLIRRDAGAKPIYFFLGYGQGPGMTKRNIELAESEGPVAGYLLWSWGLSDSIHESWLGTDPEKSWAAMIESLP